MENQHNKSLRYLKRQKRIHYLVWYKKELICLHSSNLTNKIELLKQQN